MKAEGFKKLGSKLRRSWWLYLAGFFVVLILLQILMSINVVQVGEGLVVINRWGPIPAWQPGGLDGAIVVKAGQRGVQPDPLGEGIHFLLPILYDSFRIKQVVIKEGQVGIKVRLHGKELPAGQTLASKDDQFKGIIREPLKPGRYLLNTRAETVLIRPAVIVPPGHVGVRVQLHGKATFTQNLYVISKSEKNGLDMRGVHEETKSPGTYYVNPFAEKIIPVDVRSKLLKMTDQDEIHFPSKDGFDITLSGEVRWRINPREAAMAYVKFIDTTSTAEKAIEEKLILPEARSWSRIKGSEYPAAEFIGGLTRTKFQNEFSKELSENCKKYHIEIEAARITDIKPPHEIATIIQKRYKLKEELKALIGEIEKEKKRISFEETRVLQDREKRLKEIAAEMESLETKAGEEVEVGKIEARQKQQVAQQDKISAEYDVKSQIKRAEAAATVIRQKNLAEAAGFLVSKEAFGGGSSLARYELLRKLAPSIQYILGNTEGEFAKMFQEIFRGATIKGGK